MEENHQPSSRHLAVDGESLRQPAGRKKGGWITFPFIAVAILLGVDAAQISTLVNGCLSVAPVAGAIVADAFFGCYPVVAVSMAFSVLALVVFTLTASVRGLRPAKCQPGPGLAAPCEQASAGQMAALYAGVFLMCVSAAGVRFNQATMGADQFDEAADRDVFFNWYFILFYVSSVLGSTVIVYVQDTVSWQLGYGLTGVASVVSLAALLLGARYYRRPAAQGSPFTGMARVIVAATRKRKLNVAAPEERKFYHDRRSDDNDGQGSCSKRPL
ncbi:hypothetical protein GUJ93_ZPchr0010g10940 [Zizania palustris]|uniref:Uncharacterized protein n=1 Tax=Zizania palustris TaxID=103762 RepID=A0A8J5W8D4_ZIZPA|nr:hypothetical protein GUJ93_ZPchr0010g10940 [Zizania palustris]